MNLLVVFREEQIRRCFLGVYSTVEKAEKCVDDYKIIAVTLDK